MNNNNNSGGVGFLELLLLVNITLKLCGIITWKWFFVLYPLWIYIFLILLVVWLFGGKNGKD